MEKMSRTIRNIATTLGAVTTGIVSRQALEGGPPSADLSYVMPKAKSALCFALALDQNKIEAFLQKKDRLSHDRDNVQANILASGIALEVANFLSQKGYPSLPQASNLVYRTDTPNGALDEKPPLAHRYLAVRSGIGWFGRSGNIIAREHGAGIILGSVVTEADLIPTEPLPAEENYCDDCALCFAVCASGYMHKTEKTRVSLGRTEYSYAKRRHHNRCDYVCGGFTGLHPSGKWSTWSPGRFPIPDQDDEFLPAIINAAQAYRTRPKLEGGFHHGLMPGYRIWLTCGHCQLICVPDKEKRKKRHKMVLESGVVVQSVAGSLQAVSPEEGKKRIEAMSSETRAWYQ